HRIGRAAAVRARDRRRPADEPRDRRPPASGALRVARAAGRRRRGEPGRRGDRGRDHRRPTACRSIVAAVVAPPTPNRVATAKSDRPRRPRAVAAGDFGSALQSSGSSIVRKSFPRGTRRRKCCRMHPSIVVGATVVMLLGTARAQATPPACPAGEITLSAGSLTIADGHPGADRVGSRANTFILPTGVAIDPGAEPVTVAVEADHRLVYQ